MAAGTILIGVGTEDAAVTFERFEKTLAFFALIEEQARIFGNRLERLVRALRTGDCGFHVLIIHLSGWAM